jgi:hypothetical protein
MADDVQPDVAEVPHAVENAAQPRDVARWNVRNTGVEPYRWNDIRKLYGLHLVGDDFTLLQPVPGFALEQLRILRPLHERFIARQLPLDRLPEFGFGNPLGSRDRESQKHRQQQ